MRAPIIAALVLALAAPAFPQTTLGSGPTPSRTSIASGPMPRPADLKHIGASADARSSSVNRRANLAALSRINASIRAVSRKPRTAETRARLRSLRAAAARTRAALQRPSYGSTEGVPHGVSIPARDR